MKEKGENQPRDLYSIRGFKDGEYDNAIPACWFVTPPIKLDSSGKEMEALRVSAATIVSLLGLCSLVAVPVHIPHPVHQATLH